MNWNISDANVAQRFEVSNGQMPILPGASSAQIHLALRSANPSYPTTNFEMTLRSTEYLQRRTLRTAPIPLEPI